MATISELVVKISTKSTDLARGLKDSSSKITSFAKSATKKLAKIGTLVSAAVTAGLAGILSMVKKTGMEIDKLAKTSKKLGVEIEALQKLQFQAKVTGVSVETLNMALQRAVRRIAEAAQGTGEAVKALEELGLDAKALARLSPDKQFEKIAGAMKNIGNQGDKVRLAMKLFDSEGVALVNTLNSNLAQTGAEFDSLGVAISKQQAVAVEAFNDAQTKLSTVWDGFKMQLTAAVAPALEMLLEKTLAFIKQMGGIEPIAKSVASAVITGVSGMIKAFQFLGKVVAAIQGGFMQVARLGNKVLEVGLKTGILAPTDGRTKEQALREVQTAALDRQLELNQIQLTLAASSEDIDSVFGDLLSSLDKHKSTVDKQIAQAEKGVQKGFGTISDASGRTMSVGTPGQSQGGYGIITGEDGRRLTVGNVPGEFDNLESSIKNTNMVIQDLRSESKLLVESVAENARKTSVQTDTSEGLQRIIHRLHDVGQGATTVMKGFSDEVMGMAAVMGALKGVISKDVVTGQQSASMPQKVDVQITADRERLVNAVVTSTQFKDRLSSEVSTQTKDAARATRR